MDTSRKKNIAITGIVVALAAALVAATIYFPTEQRDVDEETQTCGCSDPDHVTVFYLQKGVECGRTIPTLVGIEPRNVVMPPELSWIQYGTTGMAIQQFFMGGIPDTTGTFVMSFDVLSTLSFLPMVPTGHHHLIFEIWE